MKWIAPHVILILVGNNIIPYYHLRVIRLPDKIIYTVKLCAINPLIRHSNNDQSNSIQPAESQSCRVDVTTPAITTDYKRKPTAEKKSINHIIPLERG